MQPLDEQITVEYHDTLNPALWDGDEMLISVRVTLLKSAYAFVEFLDVPDLKIKKVLFVGSNASYNYTDYSDCDVHIVIDFDESPCPELAENFFDTKKTLWNKVHAGVNVKGYNVELYAEDVKNPTKAAGIYDLLEGKWINKPKKEKPSFNSEAVEAKVDALANEIDAVCTAGDIEDITLMFDHLRKMRRAGLQKAGEFSTENLAFKTIRNLGYIDKLSAARLKLQNDDLSLTVECPICETPEGGFDRCTVQTVNAFADYYHFQHITRESDIPITGADVVHALESHNLHYERDQSAAGKPLSAWVPAHRTGTWYVSTDGHAMALINGTLVDAEHKGPDNRRIVAALQFKR